MHNELLPLAEKIPQGRVLAEARKVHRKSGSSRYPSDVNH